ncbi:MAG TPA: FG-GAP repeat protein, partial [Planctomycetota bacterium]|nr:FG-GAP repeat protein [Planctomycetota bacterium]
SVALGGEEWTAYDGGTPHWFGYSVATADGWRLGGAPMENRAGAQAGAAYLLDTTIPGMVEKKFTPLVRTAGQRFGWAVDVSPNIMVIGAPGQGAMFGEAFVFERSGETWSQTAILSGVPGYAGDGFGSAVAIDGDRILVGAPGDPRSGVQSGVVYSFRRGEVLWYLEDTLQAPHTNAGDQFGFALDADRGRVVVGAFSANIAVYNEGAAYVFEQAASGYQFTAELWAPAPRPDSMFARSVGILGDRIAVGATEDHWSDVRTGSVTLYALQAGTWQVEDVVHAPDRALGNAFGYALALQPEGLIVGAPLATSAGVRSGAAYVFHPIGPRWGVTDTLQPSVTLAANDYVGVSVSIASDGAIVGAMRSCTKSYNAGAVHLFGAEDYDVPLVVEFCGCEDGGPCGTDPLPHGCENSTGVGAQLVALGSTSVRADNLALQASGIPNRSQLLFLIGQAGEPTPWYDGRWCLAPVNGSLGTLESTKAKKSGVVTTSRSLLRLGSRLGLDLLAGTTWSVQAIYYDSHGPCGTRYNATNALMLTLVP